MVAMNDADLIAQAVRGERLALNRLLLTHYGPLTARVEKRIPGALRSVIAPEDVLQEVFTEVFQTIASFRPAGSDGFYRWLATIADHRLLDVVRAHRAAKRGGGRAVATLAQSSIAPLVELVAVTERTPSVSASGREAAAAVQIGLAGLEPAYREVLTLRYLRGLTVAEAAERMGRTEGSMHRLCSRALLALRGAMAAGSGGEREP
jgi:RNA polymerase sigma-70 factor (ECF subfamily)